MITTFVDIIFGQLMAFPIRYDVVIIKRNIYSAIVDISLAIVVNKV